jgi:hypothetical protein
MNNHKLDVEWTSFSSYEPNNEKSKCDAKIYDYQNLNEVDHHLVSPQNGNDSSLSFIS